MRRNVWLVGLVVLVAAGCGSSVNVEQERNNLLAADREWSQTTKDIDKWVSYFAPDGSSYVQGRPVATGPEAIRKEYATASAMPGFALTWTATKADLGASGDIGYTQGTYEVTVNGATEKGRYVTVWKKQSDGTWKIAQDIGNSEAPPAMPPSQHVATAASAVAWGDAPPVLPAGAKIAVVSGDPGKTGLFTLRLQMPAGYTIAPHWHPTDEHVTVLSGTFALGMGEKLDKASMKDLSSGGYALLPAEMRHYAMAKGATTVQVSGMGPFMLNYVNPADDPSKK